MSKVIYGPVKVLFLIHNPGITGPGRIVQGLAKYINKQEFSLDVLCPEKGILPDELKKIGIRVIPLEYRKVFRKLGDFLSLRRILHKVGYHIFHIHSGQLNAFSKIMAKSLNVPAVVLTDHLAVPDHRWIKNRLALRLHLLSHRLSDLLVDKVIAVSNKAREAFITRQGIAPGKIETVYNGVDLEEFQAQTVDRASIKAKWGIPVDSPVLATVGRLSSEKGHKIFVMAALEIIKEYPQTRFMLIGDGPERQNLEKMAAQSGLKEKFVFPGFIQDTAALLEIIDVVVQPSFEAGESFGLTAVEAMAKAKAVIASDIGCFKEIISDGRDGLLFFVGDHLSLAEKIRLLLRDPGLRDTLGREAQNKIRDNFDIRTMVRKTEEVYKKLLRQKGFIFYLDHVRELEDKFIDALNREVELSPERIDDIRKSLKRLLSFVRERKHTNAQINEYLSGEYFFLIEKFMQFIQANKVFLDPISRYNCRLFKQEIRNCPVSAKDYDQRIGLQNEQFQIVNYYQPKDPALKSRIDLILSYLNPQEKDRILDVGCGVGTFVFHCAQSGACCEGVDYSQESLNMAKKLVSRFGLEGRVRFSCCDVSQGLPFADGTFNKVVAADFIEHLGEVQKIKLLSEVHRLLSPGGKAVIFTPNLLREWLGAFKSKLGGALGGAVSETRLHFGLIDRFRFERMLKNNDFKFKRVFLDVNRPYLAKIPVFKEVLSLNLLWVIEKK